jgi:hypothetical protein
MNLELWIFFRRLGLQSILILKGPVFIVDMMKTSGELENVMAQMSGLN